MMKTIKSEKVKKDEKLDWEELKQKQTDFLKELYPHWNGTFDGSVPAELAYLMELSFKAGIKIK